MQSRHGVVFRTDSMKRLRHGVLRFLSDDSGPTCVEYLFMLALVVFAALAGATILGNTTKELLDRARDRMP